MFNIFAFFSNFQKTISTPLVRLANFFKSRFFFLQSVTSHESPRITLNLSFTTLKQNITAFNLSFLSAVAYALPPITVFCFLLKNRILYYINNWVYATNHRRIAVNYFWFVILAGIVGMVLATVIRLELAYPGIGIFAGDSLQYLSISTAHGVIMVFFMIMPLLFGAFGNFLLPTQLGVHDVAFPRLNSAAFWFLPAGLIMLAQLVCIDRRYQRMNCFNIREIQSLLKKKFFTDLINNHEHKLFLNKTLLGMKYKLNEITYSDLNMTLFFQFGLVSNLAKKNVSFNFADPTKTVKFGKLNFLDSYFFTTFCKHPSFFFFFTYFYTFANTIFLKLYGLLQTDAFFSFNFFNQTVSTLLQETQYKLAIARIELINVGNFIYSLPTLIYDFLFYYHDLIHWPNTYELETKPYFLEFVWDKLQGDMVLKILLTHGQMITAYYQNINFETLTTPVLWNAYVHNLFFLITNFFTISTLSSLVTIYYSSKQAFQTFYQFLPQTFALKESIFGNFSITTYIKTANLEMSAFSKFQKTQYPVFKYDYKAGNFFPKNMKEAFPYLFTTIAQLTNSLRPAPWYFAKTFIANLKENSPQFIQLITNTAITAKPVINKFNKSLPLSPFYSFFHQIQSTPSIYITNRWTAFNVLNQKFYKMFATASMQQRIYTNWRELKFTREAWRCKMLTARHQKTLYKRYFHENGLFWSLERNAKDLLPGWAMITPFSSRTRFTAIGKVDIGLMGVLLVLNASIISSANFLVTYRYLSTLNNRKMRDARAFFAEGLIVASWMMIAANPMLIIGIIMLLFDRHWQTSFFDYSGGGDTIMFQHMFWFFGHPEVYIIMIPVFGFTNTIMSYYLRKRISARASLLYSMYTIAFLGFFVWGHHMYMVGLAHTTRMLFSTLTVMISVPAATKLMHWCVTLTNSFFNIEIPFLFILMFIFFFVSGGISGMCVAHTGMDILFHDTFYVIGHFHVMLSGAAMFGAFGAFYFYFVAIFGVKYSRIFAYLHYAYYLFGQLMTVIPMFWLGYAGMPRRVLDYPASMGGWHSVISAGHLVSTAGIISFFIMIFDSLRQRKAVLRNTFGVNRFNTRINFYIFAFAKLTTNTRKNLHNFRFTASPSLQLNKLNFANFEKYELTLLSYEFQKK